ncbi:hypothetical protein E8E12_010847 [Didymella heteroderae]|uniref:Apple domain-containing protein n=1 Tax=Didymella heteroderae TaxID=1769908 RepID=A0A9P4WYU4_9PLEO|nr:hypothetical protein E8E12_010847 [Didymella heteroderae]
MGTCPSSVICPENDGCTYFSFFQGFTRLQVNCGVDFYGGDYNIGRTSTLESCMQACAREQQCIGLSYVGLNCYLKNTSTSAEPNANVVGVTVVSRGATSANPVDVVCPDTYTCPDNDGCTFRNSDLDRAFTLSCGVDYYGGDFAGTDAASLLDCSRVCAADERCVAASFAGGSGSGRCYLKDRNNGVSPNDFVDAIALYTRIAPDPALVSSTASEATVLTTSATSGPEESLV